jgi:hypothetical protein
MKITSILGVFALTALFSVFSVAGFLLTYSQEGTIHGIGNFLYISSSVWSVIAIILRAYFLLKKVPARITLVPAISAFMGMPFVYLTVTVFQLEGYTRPHNVQSPRKNGPSMSPPKSSTWPVWTHLYHCRRLIAIWTF